MLVCYRCGQTGNPSNTCSQCKIEAFIIEEDVDSFENIEESEEDARMIEPGWKWRGCEDDWTGMMETEFLVLFKESWLHQRENHTFNNFVFSRVQDVQSTTKFEMST